MPTPLYKKKSIDELVQATLIYFVFQDPRLQNNPILAREALTSIQKAGGIGKMRDKILGKVPGHQIGTQMLETAVQFTELLKAQAPNLISEIFDGFPFTEVDAQKTEKKSDALTHGNLMLSQDGKAVTANITTDTTRTTANPAKKQSSEVTLASPTPVIDTTNGIKKAKRKKKRKKG